MNQDLRPLYSLIGINGRTGPRIYSFQIPIVSHSPLFIALVSSAKMLNLLKQKLRNNNTYALLAFLCLSLFLSWILSKTVNPFRGVYQQFTSSSMIQNDNERTIENEAGFRKKVVFGLVSCGNGENRVKYNEQMAVLIKSVMISAEIYKVHEIEFHHFLEHPEDEEVFRDKLEDMGYPTSASNGRDDDNTPRVSSIQVKLYAHSIKQVKIPRQFGRAMIAHSRFRCGYVRFYFPSALPHVDALLYLDTDTIVTGNVMDVWNVFSKMRENDMQMIGAVNDMEPENDQFPEKVEWCVHGIPHLTKSGFNSGILWMNLTRMRAFGWEERVTRIYQDYSRLVEDLVDQKMLNIFGFYNPDRFYFVPCNFNFGPAACEKGLFCNGVESDPLGIQIVHGNDRSFSPGKSLHGVYQHFRDVAFSASSFSNESMKKNLMRPIRDYYSYFNFNVTESTPSQECQGTLSNVLFPNHFSWTLF